VSWQALQFALRCDKHESTTERVVLIEYANHADDRGYTWPSKRFIASVCRLHHATVARATDALIAKKLIFRTKKRRGNTRQVEVFRMPKCTYESGLQSDASKSTQSVGKASHKRRISGLLYDTNLEPSNQEPSIRRTSSRTKDTKIGVPGATTNYSLSGEKDLLDSLSRMLGDREMKSNGGMWRMRMRGGKDYRKALRNALEDFQVKTPDQQGKIHNRGAWLTDRFERCLAEIETANGSNAACVALGL
jgi:Helix-turn-helix domain